MAIGGDRGEDGTGLFLYPAGGWSRGTTTPRSD